VKVFMDKVVPDKLICEVIDTGIGIKKKDLKTLFKFYGKIKQANHQINPTGKSVISAKND
jgi:signal transduction histidine kinase